MILDATGWQVAYGSGRNQLGKWQGACFHRSVHEDTYGRKSSTSGLPCCGSFLPCLLEKGVITATAAKVRGLPCSKLQEWKSTMPLMADTPYVGYAA